MKGNAQRGAQLAFGSFGIKAMESTWITGRQIEAARQAIVRCMKREGQIWIRIFPDKPITKKPAEVRMGKGKGSPEGFVAPVTPGRILIEAEGVPLAVAQEALREEDDQVRGSRRDQHLQPRRYRADCRDQTAQQDEALEISRNH